MSSEATGAAWKHSPLKGDQLLVHLAIADVVNDMHDNRFWMVRPNLAKKARTSTATAARALKALLADGWLEVLTEGGGRGKATEYRYSVTPETVSNLDGLADETVSLSAETVSNDEEHPLTNPREPKDLRAGASRAARADRDQEPFEADFDKTWKHYPRKEARKAALKQYQARRRAGDDPQEMHLAAQRYARLCRETGRALMLGSTFFGPNDRWRHFLDFEAALAAERAAGSSGSGRPEAARTHLGAERDCPLGICDGSGWVPAEAGDGVDPCPHKTDEGNAA